MRPYPVVQFYYTKAEIEAFQQDFKEKCKKIGDVRGARNQALTVYLLQLPFESTLPLNLEITEFSNGDVSFQADGVRSSLSERRLHEAVCRKQKQLKNRG
jgi:hypothetical protein